MVGTFAVAVLVAEEDAAEGKQSKYVEVMHCDWKRLTIE